MKAPFFYIPEYQNGQVSITLDEDNSRHAIQVLRMGNSEYMHITNGKGYLLTAVITDAHKRNCVVRVEKVEYVAPAAPQIAIAISLLKNNARFEWFLEKATEIGIHHIIPLICERTEKQQFRYGRMNSILISALLQSKQTWLPVLHEPVKLLAWDMNGFEKAEKYIAHCEESDRQSLANLRNKNHSDALLLIGPEGDFTSSEIAYAQQSGCRPVTLGYTRLRTETAGMVGAVLLQPM